MTADDPRIHLIVLFGGQSAEHDVSCTSATHVLRAANPARYRITPVGITRDGTWTIADAALAALAEGPSSIPDRLVASGTPTHLDALIADGATNVVVPLLHGPMGEDGTMQGLLELANVPFVGSGVLASAVAMDKAMAKDLTSHHGIPQARHVSLRADRIHAGTAAELIANLGLPLFVKPANMGSSVGVSKAKDEAQLVAAIELALKYDEWIVVEEAIVGREIEVAVLGGLHPEASLPGEVVPGAEFYDYDDKYVDDGSRTLIPAPLTPEQTAEVRALAVRAFEAMRCDGLARVDFFLEEGGRGFLLNEVNTIPGFTPISMYPKMWAATGVDSEALIDRLVDLAIERHDRQRRNTSH
jgi:D-alanine-D-alanine ligase